MWSPKPALQGKMARVFSSQLSEHVQLKSYLAVENILYMKKTLILLLAVQTYCAFAQLSPHKEKALASIKNHQTQLIDLSDQIWAFAETALREHKSSAVNRQHETTRSAENRSIPRACRRG